MQHQYTALKKFVNDSYRFFNVSPAAQSNAVVNFVEVAFLRGETLGKREQFALVCEVHAVLTNAADFAWKCGRFDAAQALQTAANWWYTNVVCYR